MGEGTLLALVAVSVVTGLGLFSGKKEDANKPQETAPPTPEEPAVRESDALYQNGKFAGRAVASEVDQVGQEVRFDQIENTEDLLLADEFEFQKYVLLVRKVGYATKVARESPHKGRILRGVVAKIVGYREH